MHINICDTHDTLKQTRGKIMLQISATNQLLKIKNKSDFQTPGMQKSLSYDKVSKNILSPPPPTQINYLSIEFWINRISTSIDVKFCHLLHIDADALAVKQHKEHSLDGGGHRCDEVAGDGLQNELSGRLLRKTVSTQKINNN